MALTRKMLSAMDIPAEKIDEIISAHTETVNALKEERDSFKAEIDALKPMEQELKTVKDELEKLNSEKSKSEDWHKKYDDIKSEYDNFKTDTQNKETKAAKVSAYRKLLKEAGVSENRLDSILKVSAETVDKIKLDKDGNVEDADKLIESAKKEWADFIPTKTEKGAEVANPPANNGGDIKKPSRAAEMVAKYRNEHYGNPIKEG